MIFAFWFLICNTPLGCSLFPPTGDTVKGPRIGTLRTWQEGRLALREQTYSIQCRPRLETSSGHAEQMGRRYLSDAASLVRPRLSCACFIISGFTVRFGRLIVSPSHRSAVLPLRSLYCAHRFRICLVCKPSMHMILIQVRDMCISLSVSLYLTPYLTT